MTVLADLIGAAITRESHLEKLSNADAAVRGSPAIVYRFSTDTLPPRLIYVSDNVATFGATSADLLADPGLYLARIHPDDREAARRSFVTAENGKGGALEFRIVDAKRQLPLGGKSIHAQAGCRLADWWKSAGVLVDVTERKARRREVTVR